MNRCLSILLSLLLILLMSACTQGEEINESIPSTDQNLEVDPESPEQEEPDMTEEPAKQEDQSGEDASEEAQDLSWVVSQPEKMSYEAYFSEDRPYSSDYRIWLVPDGQSWKGYTLEFDYDYGLQVVRWDNSWSERVAVYTVPDTLDFDMFELLGTDGTMAYYISDSTSFVAAKDSIMALDILTGSREYLIEDAVITSVYYYGDVLYYALYQDDMMQIVRRYLPTGDELYYPTGQKLAPMFSFYTLQSSSSPITWVGVTDKMTAAVMNELQDPNSTYRNSDRVPPVLWEMEEPWIYAAHNPVHWLCYELQESKGYRTLYKCTMDSDGSMTSEATGIVDRCWYGSDMSHDHFHPDAAPPAKPVASIGSWIEFPEKMMDTEELDPEYSLEIYQNHVYSVVGNTFTLLTDMPMHSVYRTYAEYSDSMDAYYGITVDDQLVRLYSDGRTPTVLYQGTNIRTVSSQGDYLIVLDEDQVIQMDLVNQRYRTVLRHENILWLYFDVESSDEPSEVVYIALNRGLHSTGYLFNLATGDVTEEGYRL